MLEKEIEKKVCDYAKSKGCLVYKFVSPAHRGVPDRMFVTQAGKVFFIEFKALGKKPTPLQLHEMKKMEDSNVSVSWTDNVSVGKMLIDLKV